MPITVRAFRADHQWYRAWEARVVFQSVVGVVTVAEPGGRVVQLAGGWVSPYRIQAYYWFDRPYNLLEVFTANGTMQELHVHIATPARWVGDELHYTDHELDVVQLAGGAIQVFDQKEFAAAQIVYGYHERFVAACHEACHRAERLLASWQIGAPPAFALAVDDS